MTAFRSTTIKVLFMFLNLCLSVNFGFWSHIHLHPCAFLLKATLIINVCLPGNYIN